ncbi:MAG: holo-ACP synthase [Verrucomicrobiota bacterium]
MNLEIAGSGIDLVEVERIEKLLERSGKRFRNRIFTEGEQHYCEAIPRPAIRYAARFAAKEAISKAFGTGIGEELGWRDMEIEHDARGKPLVRFSGEGLKLVEKRRVQRVEISLTHTEVYAAAVAILVVD